MIRTAVFMAIALAAIVSGARAGPGEVRLCTGSSIGNYAKVGDEVARRTTGTRVVVVKDTGGTWGNVDRTAIRPVDDPTACDAFIGQPDGVVVLKQGYYDEAGKLVGANASAAAKITRIGQLHREYLHVVCGKNLGIDSITDLAGQKSKVAVGSEGSGAWLVWQNLTYEDASYKTLVEEPIGGIDAAAAAANGDVACWIQPAGIGNGEVREANDLFGDQLVLVDVDDWDFNDAVDADGNAMYEFKKLDGSYYPALVSSYWSGSIQTISWTAGFYINVDRVSREDRTNLLRGVASARKWAEAEFGG